MQFPRFTVDDMTEESYWNKIESDNFNDIFVETVYNEKNLTENNDCQKIIRKKFGYYFFLLHILLNIIYYYCYY